MQELANYSYLSLNNIKYLIIQSCPQFLEKSKLLKLYSNIFLLAKFHAFKRNKEMFCMETISFYFKQVAFKNGFKYLVIELLNQPK